MIEIDWNPVPHLGPIPVNWYGFGWAAAYVVGLWLVRRWTPRATLHGDGLDAMSLWVLFGAMIGARLYYIAQNEPAAYLAAPWRILAVWQGGLAYFGGLFGGIGAAYLYTRRHGLSFARVADAFAPAIPVAAAIGRIPCFLDGMDYGTPTRLPWGVTYTNPKSYAPVDGVSRHPDQVYELLGDLVIAGVLLRLRGRVAPGALFLWYLILFSALRFALFFVRGNVPVVGLGLKNGQWTALAILAVAVPALVVATARARSPGRT